MKRRLLFMVLVLLLASVMPASADGRELTGERIYIFNDNEITFSAGTPFHIRHGFILSPDVSVPIGVYSFKLKVDGVRYPSTFLLVTVETGDGPASQTRLWAFNFPAGMSGDHTFNGFWYSPCQEVLPLEDCSTPNAPVLTRSTTVLVHFE